MRRKTLPPVALASWAKLNNVTFNGVHIEYSDDGRGYGARSVRQCQVKRGEPLLLVPSDLILSVDAVHNQAKVDRYLAELLTAAEDLSKSARGMILLYLLHQVTISSLDCHENIGLSGPFTEYLHFLSEVSLPTTWSEHEQELLAGTSLEAALRAKLQKLRSEFEQLRVSTQAIPWCRRLWWNTGADTEQLRFEDWVLVDSWYRSRALSFGIDQDALVAIIDMINHTCGESVNAYFDRLADGNVALLTPGDRSYEQGQEVTISYGDSKSASEMMFSYGFLNEGEEIATALSLDLHIPDDDPLKKAKETASTVAPAVRISLHEGEVRWESTIVWLSCVNEEDGLSFKVLLSTDGERELKMFWKEQDITQDSSCLGKLLEEEQLWNVFHLRAVTIIQQRVEQQLRRLMASDEQAEAAQHSDHVSPMIWQSAMSLRHLESQLLLRAYGELDDQRELLLATDVVESYLGRTDDFDHDDDAVHGSTDHS